MNDKIRSYTAGIIDGEGHIGCYRRPNNSYDMRISVQMKYDKVPNWLLKNWGGIVFYSKSVKWTWRARETLSIKILNEVEKYMVEKKDQSYIYKKLFNLKQKNIRINQFSSADSPELLQEKDNLYLLLRELHN